VVRAPQPADATLRRVQQARAAVPAGVAERPRQPVVVGDDDHGVRAELDGQEVPALAQRGDVARAHPLAGEQVRELPLGHAGVGERGARELGRALERQAGALDGVEREVEDRDGGHSLAPSSR